MVMGEDGAAVWQWVTYRPFRGMDGDICVQVKAEGSTFLLCSDERRKAVMLLAPKEVDMLDPRSKEFLFNKAWELTPDQDFKEDAFLALYCQ